MRRCRAAETISTFLLSPAVLLSLFSCAGSAFGTRHKQANNFALLSQLGSGRKCARILRFPLRGGADELRNVGSEITAEGTALDHLAILSLHNMAIHGTTENTLIVRSETISSARMTTETLPVTREGHEKDKSLCHKCCTRQARYGMVSSGVQSGRSVDHEQPSTQGLRRDEVPRAGQCANGQNSSNMDEFEAGGETAVMTAEAGEQDNRDQGSRGANGGSTREEHGGLMRVDRKDTCDTDRWVLLLCRPCMRGFDTESQDRGAKIRCVCKRQQVCMCARCGVRESGAAGARQVASKRRLHVTRAP